MTANNDIYTYMYVCIYMYREVHKARDRETGKLVALKKVRMENEKEGVSWMFADVSRGCCVLSVHTVPNDGSEGDPYPPAPQP